MKHFKNLTLVIATVGMLLFASCGNDDDFDTNPGIDPVNFELNGTQEGDRILDPSQAYTLTGSYIVKDGATLTIPAGTQSGHRFRLRGKGMPVINSSNKGDLYVDVYTEIPVSLNKQQRKALEELQNLEENSNHPESNNFTNKVKKIRQ